MISESTKEDFSGLDTQSADMKPAICNWQRMVIGDSTVFTYWIIHEVVGHIE